MFTKNLKCLAVLCALTLSLTAVEAQAATLISDNFYDGTATNIKSRLPGTTIEGRTQLENASFTPTYNLTTGVPSSGAPVPDGAVVGGQSSYGTIDITDGGSYTKPNELTISGDLMMGPNPSGNGTFTGVGLGFWEDGTTSNAARVDFVGVVMDVQGNLNLQDFNTKHASVAFGAGPFLLSTFYHLSYTIDIANDEITAISFTGPNAPSAAAVDAAFLGVIPFGAGDAVSLALNTNYAGFYSHNGVGKLDYVDNFLLEGAAAVPEPSTLVLAFLGLLGLVAFGWRRKRRQA